MIMVFFQVKLVAIDNGLNVVYEDGIKFDVDLPEFRYRSDVLLELK